MPFTKLNSLSAASYVALLAATALSAPLAAQVQASGNSAPHSRYILKDLGTLGGANSEIIDDNHGTLIGLSDTPDWNPNCGCPVSHAFRWDAGLLTDLGSLPAGKNFSQATAINSRGLIAGIADNGRIDPTTGIEAFVATLWTKDGRIINLGTFGGSFSLPDDINDRGDVVGGAENTIPDPFNFGGLLSLPSPTHWRAALWRNGTKRDLGTLGGTDSFAYFVNKRGQIAGDSSINSIPTYTGFPAIHPFRWENGRMVDLGTLGGPIAYATGQNNRGQVVGDSDLPGALTYHAALWTGQAVQDLGTFGGDNSSATTVNDNGEVAGRSDTADGSSHAFLWREGVMADLGVVPGDGCSVAHSINSRAQVVGESFPCDYSLDHAFLSENGGPMVDLNTLIPSDSEMLLIEGNFINDDGEIAGLGLLPNGDVHGFLLIPRNGASSADGVFRATTVTRGRLTPQALAALRSRVARRHPGVRGLLQR